MRLKILAYPRRQIFYLKSKSLDPNDPRVETLKRHGVILSAMNITPIAKKYNLENESFIKRALAKIN